MSRHPVSRRASLLIAWAATAAATIDAIGVEREVIRAGFVIAAAMTAVTGMVAAVIVLL